MRLACFSAAEPGSALDVVVPCIPAREIACFQQQQQQQLQFDLTFWPEGLRRPLIKVPQASAGEPKAVASGCRSCLVKLNGSWYRLKGCGNNADGFIVRLSPGYDGVLWRDIRGCAFPHTAVRENYMTALLNEKLTPLGIMGCNTALGMYLYSPPNCPLGGGAISDLRPACIVEATKGDRRLGSHVLAGMELLLPLLVNEAALTEDELLAMFPPHRPKSDTLEGLPATAELMCVVVCGAHIRCVCVHLCMCVVQVFFQSRHSFRIML